MEKEREWRIEVKKGGGFEREKTETVGREEKNVKIREQKRGRDGEGKRKKEKEKRKKEREYDGNEVGLLVFV